MPLRVGLIGTGGVTLANHLPGLQLCPDVEVAAVCDANPEALARARQVSGASRAYADAFDLLKDAPVEAVVIATPNDTHKPIALAAVASGRHVLCEKPLSLSALDAFDMWQAAERAGVRHMTAFTYRFVPAMQWMKHLVDRGDVGTPWHFRAQRFQDWQRRALGWRQQQARAGSGELGDMLSHRLDFAHHLVGPISRVAAAVSQVWDVRLDERQQPHAADVEDWVGCLVRFETGATGVFESSKVATGHSEGPRSRDYCEVNGSDGGLIYELSDPLRLKVTRGHGAYDTLDVPADFRVLPGSPRDPDENPWQAFRYDQAVAFVQAIRAGRPCSPSFEDGYRAQAVMDGILEAARTGRWIDLPAPLAVGRAVE